MLFNPIPVMPTTVATEPAIGYEAIGRRLAEALQNSGRRPVIAADGMWGVPWPRVTAALAGALGQAGLDCEIVATAQYLRPAVTLRSRFAPWLTDNPVFGRVCDLDLAEYFDRDALQQAVADASQRAAVLVVGPYAFGAGAADIGLYWDLPREEIIRRQMHEGLRNLGDDLQASPGARYKVAYYVEWPLLEAHKRHLIRDARSALSLYVDGTEDRRPVAVSAEALRSIVADVAARPLRCRPFFMPGVWGGQRLKELAGLPLEWPNCAWDFEIVAPENAVTVRVGGARLNLPFHLLTWLCPDRLMGERVCRQFGEYFPLRINFLDTMGGTNLSLQVHPHHTYMRQEFGEPIGQDESYYIVESRPGAKVYLGFREQTTKESLHKAVRRAETEQVAFEISDYVNAWEARVGDLFLIPAGTVHCSGANNLVLEISSTPYWYTFKLYDYLRPDLDGKPRPINSEHGLAVADFTRKTGWVQQHLMQAPVLVRQEAGGAEYHIGSTAQTFYAVHRLHLTREMSDHTDGGFLLLSTVEGEGVQVLAPDEDRVMAEIPYLETWVVPAEFGAFRLRATGARPCQVVKTYVRK